MCLMHATAPSCPSAHSLPTVLFQGEFHSLLRGLPLMPFMCRMKHSFVCSSSFIRCYGQHGRRLLSGGGKRESTLIGEPGNPFHGNPVAEESLRAETMTTPLNIRTPARERQGLDCEKGWLCF